MAQYVYNDDAPFSVPPSTTLHYVVTVTSTAQALTAVTDITTAAAHVVPRYTDGNNETKWPKAVYIGHMNTAHDVWVTWDGASPVVGTTWGIWPKSRRNRRGRAKHGVDALPSPLHSFPFHRVSPRFRNRSLRL